MNIGKTLFAQVMEFVPWKSFGRSIAKHHGDNGVRTLSCADLFRVLAFSQLTGRESLRDIEACLAANRSKLFHMGLAQPPARSTLADALNARDWHIYQALALRLIACARTLYAHDCSVPGIDATIYALDATTIDLCLSLFDWAPVCSTRAAIKLHTLLDLRGAIPAFVYISDGKLNEVNVLDFLPVEAGSFYVMDRGYLDFRRFFAMHQAGAFFVTRARSAMDARRVYSCPADRSSGVICDQRVLLNGRSSSGKYPEQLRRIRFKDPVLHAFHRRFPHVELIFSQDTTATVALDLEAGKFDMVIHGDNLPPSSSIKSCRLRTERILLLSDAGHPLASQATIRPADLAGQNLLLTEAGCSYREKLDRARALANIRPANVTEFSSVEALKQCIGLGMGLGLLPAILVDRELRQKRIKALHWTGPSLDIVTQILWHKDKWISPAMAAFMELVKDKLMDAEPRSVGRAAAGQK